jgi:hypothetical protein
MNTDLEQLRERVRQNREALAGELAPDRRTDNLRRPPSDEQGLQLTPPRPMPEPHG